MEQLANFIKPELLVLVPVLYIIGLFMKKSKAKDEHIPYTLGIIGIGLAVMYVCGTEVFTMLSAFTAITQGILCAGASVYVNQLVKQRQK